MHDVYFFTDTHGSLNLFHTIMNYCKSQDPESIIIFGGDAADRGEDGYQIIKELLDNPYVIYLYGNHEDLFVQAADAIIGNYAKDDESYAYLHSCNKEQAHDIIKKMSSNEYVQLHLANGGESTLISWLLDNANEEIIDIIRNLPRTLSYGFMDFCHAGGVYNTFKRVADAEYENQLIPYIDEETTIWDRNMLPIGWESNRVCIFGHTPTILLPNGIYGRDKSEKNIHPCAWQDRMGAKDKRSGWKIDMDTGMVWTGRAFVLNCLTMKVYGFEVNDNPYSINSLEPYKILEE